LSNKRAKPESNALFILFSPRALHEKSFPVPFLVSFLPVFIIKIPSSFAPFACLRAKSFLPFLIVGEGCAFPE
jgi:hypothetical protein